jgi:flagellar basal-body rod protein FlgC
VHVADVMQDPSPFIRKYEPGNPVADKEGYVSYPNVDLAIEYVNALEASRAYEANVTMMETTKAMMNSSLRILA